MYVVRTKSNFINEFVQTRRSCFWTNSFWFLDTLLTTCVKAKELLPREVKPARGICHWSDLAALLECLRVLVEHRELDLGAGAFLAQREAHKEKKEEREGGHDDDTDPSL